MELNPVEARIIGSLAEKQLTTPQQYPLTLNALVLACNQSSNRDPVVAYDETTVELALSSLKEAGLLRFVHPGKGASATRYRQVLDERLGLGSVSLSVLTVLMLRGPQTVGELRTRTERMADFGNLKDLEAELERLGGGTDPMVRRLPRRAGRRRNAGHSCSLAPRPNRSPLPTLRPASLMLLHRAAPAPWASRWQPYETMSMRCSSKSPKSRLL